MAPGNGGAAILFVGTNGTMNEITITITKTLGIHFFIVIFAILLWLIGIYPEEFSLF
jgi:hypothetical protein